MNSTLARQDCAGKAGAAWALSSILLLGTAMTAPAQEVGIEVPAMPPVAPPPAPALSVEDDTLHLTLEEAIAIALTRNPELMVSRHDYEQAVAGVQRAQGIFDLNLDAEISSGETDSRSPFVIEGVSVLRDEEQVWNLALGQLTPLGGTASLQWSNQRSETTSRNVIFNPSYRAFAALAYRQPLLQGFGRRVTRSDILVAQRDREATRSQLEGEVISMVQQVANAYWDLVEARRQLEVAEEALDLAGQLHEQNRIRVEVGTLAPLELVQSEAGVAARRVEIIGAATAVGDASDQLRLLLDLDQGPVWLAEVVPDTAPDMDRYRVNLDDALATAMNRRVELAEMAARVEQARINDTVARSFVRPSLDLSLSYRATGQGGDEIVERDPETLEPIVVLPGGYSDALSEIRRREFDGWNVGLQFGVPLQNRSARANRATADVQLRAIEVRAGALQQRIAADVRSTTRRLDSAWEQVESARVSRRLAERNLEAEQRRFENGMSTSFQVLEIQNQLSAARSAEVTAVVGYRRAVIEQQRAVGELLEASGIRLAGDGANEDMEG